MDKKTIDKTLRAQVRRHGRRYGSNEARRIGSQSWLQKMA
jgi:hypothetical protein